MIIPKNHQVRTVKNEKQEKEKVEILEETQEETMSRIKLVVMNMLREQKPR